MVILRSIAVMTMSDVCVKDYTCTGVCVCICREKEVKKEVNPANFGYNCSRWCICEVPGQVPCPGFTPLPNEMRGKYKNAKADDS